jgi:hypothetical protein
MNSFDKLHEICSRLDHIEHSSEWIARSMVHVDSGASQTGSLINVLADEIRERVLDLITDLEKEIIDTHGTLRLDHH